MHLFSQNRSQTLGLEDRLCDLTLHPRPLQNTLQPPELCIHTGLPGGSSYCVIYRTRRPPRRRAALPHKTSSLDPPRTHCTSLRVVVHLNLLHCIYSGFFFSCKHGSGQYRPQAHLHRLQHLLRGELECFFLLSTLERSCGELESA